jgi:hypothetical protein
MWLSGVFLMALAVFAALIALISGERVDALGNSVRTVMVITTAVSAVLGALFIFISRSVRRLARWAYAVAILLYGVPALLWLLAPLPAALEAQIPDWSLALSGILEWVYLILAFMAVLLLAASFMRHDEATKQGRATDHAG